MRMTTSMFRTALLPGCLALAAASLSTAAFAAGKPAKPVSLTVKVSNGRSAPVTTLSLVTQGTEAAGPNLLKAPIAPGKSVSLVVKARKGDCLFDVSGAFEDDVEITGSGLNLCKDRTLALVD